LVSACQKGSLSTLSLALDTDLWVRDYDEYTPPSGRVTWYLSREKYGAELAHVLADSFIWTEKPLILAPNPWDDKKGDKESEEEEDIQSTRDPDERAKRFEAAQLAIGQRQLVIAERVRQALYVIAGALVFLTVFLVLR
jgi:hypothetical protein